MALHPIKYVWASKTTNIIRPTEQTTIENGILYEGPVVSNQLNGIEELNQYAIRELQTIGGYYDNNQIYNTNDVVFVLINEGGTIKQRFYICKNDNTTGKPPIRNNQRDRVRAVNDITIVNLSQGYTEDTSNWDLIGLYDKKIVNYQTSGKGNYKFFTGQSPLGKLKIRTFDTSGAVTMSWEVSFSGDNESFKISNVFYSSDVRKSNNRYISVYIGHPGFAIYYDKDANKDFGLSINDDTFIKKIELDYTELNFISPSVTKTTFSGYNLYAIREGGGTYIPNLGDIYHNLRNNVSAQNGDTYDFYLFARGCVPFSTAMVLNTGFYHQWANGGMPSVNIDVSDCYLVNKGVVMGQVNAVKYNESLPNIKGGDKNILINIDRQDNYFPSENQVISLIDVPNTYGGATGAGGGYRKQLYFDASRASPIYQDGAPVRGKCLVTTFLLQAF